MRPLMLKLQGIGSYRSEQTIDFSHYDDFFLIAGDTGSGKTTIFDAMMFSLYGKVAGTRSGDDLVHAGLDYDTVPFCEFSFQLSGKKYCIRRIPAYDRKKKKGEGFTAQTEAVVLKEFRKSEWVELEGKKTEIDSMITSMLKFSADEFSKLILLPQGEFEKFLISETKDKRELLEKIFPVDIYKKCSDRFSELKNSLSAEKKQISKSLSEKLKMFDPQKYEKNLSELNDSKTGITAEINRLNSESKERTVKISAAEKVLKMFAEMEQKKSESGRLAALKPEIENTEKILLNYRLFLKHKPLIEKFDYISEIHKKNVTSAEFLKRMLDSGRDEYLKLEEHFNRLPEYREELSKLEHELSLLQKVLPDYEKMKMLQNENIGLQKQIDETGKILNKSNLKLSDAETNISQLAEFRQKNSSVIENRSVLQGSIHEHEKKISESELAGKAENKWKQIEGSVLENKKDLEAAERKLDELKEKIASYRKDEERHYLEKLSKKIRSGEPCPLCGATEHPYVYGGDGQTDFSSEHLEKLELEKGLQEKTVLSLEKEIEFKFSQMKDIEVQFDKERDYAAEMKKLIAELTDLTAASAENEKIIAVLNKNETAFNENLKIKDGLNSEIIRMTSEINEKKMLLSENTMFIRNISGQLQGIDDPDASIAKLQQRIKNGTVFVKKTEEDFKTENDKRIKSESELEGHKKNIDSSDSELKSLQVQLNDVLKTENLKSVGGLRNFMLNDEQVKGYEKKIEDYKLAVAQNAESLKYFENNLKDTVKPDVSSLQTELGKIEKNLIELSEKRDGISENIIILEKNRNEYETLMRDQNALNEKFSEVEKMALILNGTNSRNMTFQDYVLAGYLQEVLNCSNRRLIKISDGQYQLRRRNSKEKGTTKSGLEFNVIDIFNGVEREVQSLSGGEKFMTSLCLALGLSDVIQSRSGGKELESLFIDEGFGSLDEQSLERAISILDEVRGSRMVGIISHVKELKTRIPSIITVKKTLQGSRIINS